MGRKHYDKAFKENAVKLSKQRKNQAELAKELGISRTAPYYYCYCFGYGCHCNHIGLVPQKTGIVEV